MSVLNQIGEELKECPLCIQPLEVDDLTFFACTCFYQICRFCWHKIRTDGNGLCPACRKAYPENPADFTPLTQEQLAELKAKKRHQDQQRKQKISESRKHLANVRVVQKNLVFVVGLPMRLADSEILKKHEYFGKFGRILKVVINQSTAYAGPQGPSASAYVTYSHNNDALRAIQSVNNIVMDGRIIKTSLGTTKYCSHFMKNLPCPKQDCMYLHEFADQEASFTKEEMHQGKHQEYEKTLHDTLIKSTATSQNKQERTQPAATAAPPPSLPTQSKEAWPSLSSTPQQNTTVKDKKTIHTLKESVKQEVKNKMDKSDKNDTNKTSSKQKDKSKDKLSNNKTSTITSSGIQQNYKLKGDTHLTGINTSKNNRGKIAIDKINMSTQSLSSGDTSPEPQNAESSDSTNDSDSQKTKSVDSQNNLYSREHNSNSAGDNSLSESNTLTDQTAQLSRLNIFDDNNSFFSTSHSYKKYLNMDQALSSSAGSHSISPDSLARSPFFELSADSEIDSEHRQRHSSKTLMNDDNRSSLFVHNMPQYPLNSSLLTDLLPPINSSEDWQAAFGFATANGRDHTDVRIGGNIPLRPSQTRDSLITSPSLTNGITHTHLQDFQNLQANGEYSNGGSNSEVQSDVEEHSLLENGPVYEPPYPNSMSQFLTDLYKSKYDNVDNFNLSGSRSNVTSNTNLPFTNNVQSNNGYENIQSQSSNAQQLGNSYIDNRVNSQYAEYCNGLMGNQISSVTQSQRLNEPKYIDHIGQHNVMYNQQNLQHLSTQQNYNQNNRNISVDDDLGFDPFHETQKALAELIENEIIQQQSHGRDRLSNGNKFNEGISQRTRLPPPGFNHMNAFGIGIPRAQGSKILPHMNSSTTAGPSNNWNTSMNNYTQHQQLQQQLHQQPSHQQQMPQQSSQNQQHTSQMCAKNYNMCSDWTTMDPAIMITSRNYANSYNEKRDNDRREGLFIGHPLGQKPLYIPTPQALLHSGLHSFPSNHQSQPNSATQFSHHSNQFCQQPSQQQGHMQGHVQSTRPSSLASGNMLNLSSSMLGQNSISSNHQNINLGINHNMGMPNIPNLNLNTSWLNSEPQSFYNSTASNGFSSNLEHKYIPLPPGFQNNNTAGTSKGSAKPECIESK